MKLDLHEIIERPGGLVPFEFDMDLSHMEFIQVSAMKAPLRITGQVRNMAGALELSAEIKADLVCICDRCMAEYDLRKAIPVEAHLADRLCDEENSDIFLLDGDYVNLGEIITTAFVLGMESKFICSENCRGLCIKCGANLNSEPCDCREDPDPRFASLQQLLSDEEE